MNRPLKFRVWSVKNNCFVTNGCELYYLLTLSYQGAINSNDIYQQYTGLTDKNGKEIYEGDIIEQNFGEKPTRGLVKFSRGSFRVIWPAEPYDDLGCMLIEYVTVIGNVFENPKMRGIYE